MHAWVQPPKNAAEHAQHFEILTRNNMCTTRVVNKSACYIDIHKKMYVRGTVL